MCSKVYYDVVNKKFMSEDPGKSILITPERLRENKIPDRRWFRHDGIFGVSSSRACYVSNIGGYEFEWQDIEEIKNVFTGVEPRIIIRNNVDPNHGWFINLY